MLTPGVTKLLCIVGPTATGKTGSAIAISKYIPSYLISADSRQVYAGMDVVTGKDHDIAVEIDGIDIVNPDQPCSVAVWQKSADMGLEYALTHGKLPIIVGGTGLYVKAMIEPIPTIGVPINEKLREELGSQNIEVLQSRLMRLDPARFYGMNNSDAHNSRRLIRAIEVAEFGKAQLSEFHWDRPGIVSQLMIGLAYTDNSLFESAVRKRVVARLKKGAVLETKKLIEKYGKSIPSLTAIGYRSIIQFIEGKLSEKEMTEKWTADEVAYAKRQMTWFRKVKGIEWHDAGDPHISEVVARRAREWYDKDTYDNDAG